MEVEKRCRNGVLVPSGKNSVYSFEISEICLTPSLLLENMIDVWLISSGVSR